MGMAELELLIENVCGENIKVGQPGDLSAYSGKTVAFDASDGLYPFLETLRRQAPQFLTKKQRKSAHLVGPLITTVRLLENNISPIYVFSGHPYLLRSEVLWQNYKNRFIINSNEEVNGESSNSFTEENYAKFFQRTAIIGKRNELECKELFKLLGIPVITAPGEAGPQCAEMIHSGQVFAAVSQDLSALSFGTNVLLKNILFYQLHELPVEEFHLQSVLEHLELTQSQLIELAILLGCHYCDGIRGVDHREVLQMVQKHHKIEKILQYENTEENRLIIPENWKYAEAREIFRNPVVANSSYFKIERTKPNIEGVVSYLVEKHRCTESGVRNILSRVHW